MNLTTSLAKAHGLGSAKSGLHHWLAQRLTAIALIPTSLWLLFALPNIMYMDYESALAWIQSPIRVVFILLFIVALLHHLQLGLQVVIEDYMHNNLVKFGSLIVLKLACFCVGLASIVSVLKIYLG